MSLKTAVKKENNRVELEIEVEAPAFEQAVERAYKKNIKRMNVPGFRKGKAPRAWSKRSTAPACSMRMPSTTFIRGARGGHRGFRL